MNSTILFDFDRTLLDTDALKIAQAQLITDITELSLEQVQAGMRSYLSTLETSLDFLPEGYAQHMQLLWGINPSDIVKIYMTDANYTRNYLFPDVVPVLTELARSYRIGIFSEANGPHQKVKIDNCGLNDFIDQTKVIIVPRKRDKDFLKNIYPGTYIIDDNIEVINALLNNGSHLVPIWLNRKDKNTYGNVTTIHSLHDLLTKNLLH